MKRLYVLMAAVLAGCSGGRPVQANPVNEKPVETTGRTLGTFTATVDLAAGTIDVRSGPTGAATGTGPSPKALLELTGLVAANGATPWIGDSTEHGCGLVPTWGANVKLTSSYTTSSATGVYAEVTSFGGGTGLYPSCKQSPGVAPDLANTFGLWSYPDVIAPAGGTQSADWTFPFVTATKFTFSGRLVGALLDDFTVIPSQNAGPIAFAGENIVYGTSTGIAFADSSGVNVGTARDLTLAPTALATTGSRIWYVTADSGVDHYPYVGFTSLDGTGGESVKVSGLGVSPGLAAIVPDPTNPNVAWFISAGSSELVRIDMTDPGAPLVTSYPTAARPTQMVVGSDNQIYVTSSDGSVVMRWNPANPGVGSVDTDTSASCPNPGSVVAGPGSTIAFTSSLGICRMTEGSTAAPALVAPAASPRTLCVGPGGYLWYMTSGGSNDGTLVRVVEGASNPWTFRLGTNAYSLACTTGSSGVAWVLGQVGSRLTRLSPSEGATVPPPLAINLGGSVTLGIASRAGLTSTGVTVVNGDVALDPLATCTDSTGGAASGSRTCLVKNLPPSATGMTVNGSIYFASDPFDNGATALRITNDLHAAWVEGMAKVHTLTVPGDQLSGGTFLPGVYQNANLGMAIGGTATLDAQNDPDAVFVYQVGTSMVDSGTLGSPTTIVLANGAQARNVWFVVGVDVTIGSGTRWKGNILAGNTVTMTSGSTVLGRVLAGAAGAGAITLTGAASPSVTSITVP